MEGSVNCGAQVIASRQDPGPSGSRLSRVQHVVEGREGTASTQTDQSYDETDDLKNPRKLLKKDGFFLNWKTDTIGKITGVEVGNLFPYRAAVEMSNGSNPLRLDTFVKDIVFQTLGSLHVNSITISNEGTLQPSSNGEIAIKVTCAQSDSSATRGQELEGSVNYGAQVIASRQDLLPSSSPLYKEQHIVETSDDSISSITIRQSTSEETDHSEDDIDIDIDKELIDATLKKYEELREKLVLRNIVRPDLSAAVQMQKKGLFLNWKTNTIGKIAGVEVGTSFAYRAAMVVIGLHGEYMAGIARMRLVASPAKFSFREKDAEIATSLVMNLGRGSPGSSAAYSYPDNEVYPGAGTVVYSGSGSPNRKSIKGKLLPLPNQKLTRGNLALQNSYSKNIPIRLILGFKNLQSPSGTTYVYAGLYKTTDVQREKGLLGNMVYKFYLKRERGEVPLPASVAAMF